MQTLALVLGQQTGELKTSNDVMLEMSIRHWCNESDRGQKTLSPWQVFQLQTSYKLRRNRTRASAVTGWRIKAWDVTFEYYDRERARNGEGVEEMTRKGRSDNGGGGIGIALLLNPKRHQVVLLIININISRNYS
jgi:hypothetical protein